MIPEYKSVSYILVWADTNTMNRNDFKHYNVDEKINQELLQLQIVMERLLKLILNAQS